MSEGGGVNATRELLLDWFWQRLVIEGDTDPADFQTQTCEAQVEADELFGDATGVEAF